MWCQPDRAIVWQSHRASPQPGGKCQANVALWHIVITRMSPDRCTEVYALRRAKEGRINKAIIRVLKRYVALEVYPHAIAAV
jgi:hypothetical protein